jgi:hypothetical protein
MEKMLANAEVVNYGRAFYYSSLELLLFLKLLRSGDIPDTAIFIDGLNDTRILCDSDIPSRQSELGEILTRGYYLDYDMFPIMKLLPTTNHGKSADTDAEIAAQKVLSVYRQNKDLIQLIARYYGVDVFFVWQPVPHYKYDLKNHLFKQPEHDPDHYNHRLYNITYATMEQNHEGVMCLADMFKDDTYVYVDVHHYNPRSCAAIAERIVEYIQGYPGGV